MESHLAAQTQDNIRAGLSRAEAHRRARLQFGAIEGIRAEWRDEKRLPLLEDLMLDVRYALRVLRKSPAFTLVATGTLMLAIGANVLVFGIVNALILRPLPVVEPGNLYQLRLKPWTSFKLLTTSYPAFQELRQRNTTLSGMAGYYGYCQARLHWQNSAKSVHGYAVTGNYFDLLGVQPAIGRLIREADDHGPGSAPYLVVSDRLWKNVFHADPAMLGAKVKLGRETFTIIGVAPVEFHGTDRFDWPDFWIPIVNYFGPDELQSRTTNALTVLGRLKPGFTSEQAANNLSAIAKQLAREHPQTDTGTPLRLIHPGLFADNGDAIRGFLGSVSGFTLLVLAAASANLTSLFAARATDRSRELALRAAVGASRSRLVQQLMTEATMVSFIGGGAGLGLASALVRVLNHWQSPYGRMEVTVSPGVYLVALVLSLGSAFLFGMIPARQVWKNAPHEALKNSGLTATTPRRFALRDLSLGAQIAICTMLVTASLVAVRGMVRMLHAPLGFQPRGALLAEMDLSEVTADMSLARKKEMIEALRNIPGVTAAGTVSRVPFNGGLRGVPIFSPGTTDLSPDNAILSPYVFTISPGYFQAAGTRRQQGRDVSWRDTGEAPRVAIVNETFARQMWPGKPAIGRRFTIRNELTEVIGVVEDGKYHNLLEPAKPAVFLPLAQNEESSLVFVVRSPRPLNNLAPAIERTLTSFEPRGIFTVRNWSDLLDGLNALFPARAAAIATGILGLLAAMLAVTGIFGTAAYNVSRRRKEFGIRLALGARAAHLVRTAVGRPLGLLGAGSFAGLWIALCAAGWFRQIAYRADPGDPMVIGGAVFIMTLLGLAASAIPALRALSIDPVKLLREE